MSFDHLKTFSALSELSTLGRNHQIWTTDSSHINDRKSGASLRSLDEMRQITLNWSGMRPRDLLSTCVIVMGHVKSF